MPSHNLNHLCAIHRRIFGDIYDWAGAENRRHREGELVLPARAVRECPRCRAKFRATATELTTQKWAAPANDAVPACQVKTRPPLTPMICPVT